MTTHRTADDGRFTMGPQPKPSGEAAPNHPVLHVNTITSDAMAAAFHRAPLTEGRAATWPSD